MGRKPVWPPSISHHNGYDRIRVTVNGRRREINLGPTGSEKARRNYLRRVAELESNHGRPPPLPGAVLTAGELAAGYLVHAEEIYSPRQFWRVKRALRPIVELYRDELAVDVGPVRLRACRQTFIDAGYCRKLCNQLVGSIRRAWRWAAGQELIPHVAAAALKDVDDLRRGRKGSPHDHPDVEPVEPTAIAATLPHLLSPVAALVRFQLLTGCRPGEAILLRPCDLVKDWRTVDGVQVWLFDLDKGHGHKNEWRGKRRKIPIGPRAQEVLRPLLEGRAAEAYVFSPIDATAEFRAEQRAARKSKVQPSQVDRSKKRPRKQPGERYTSDSYRRAIHRACDEAKISSWSPVQIRHLAGEQTEAALDQDAARCLLGHATPTTTAIYAKGLYRAAEVVAKFG